MLILSTPQRRNKWKASTAVAESCLRFIQRRIPSSNDWIPILIRLTPSDRRPRTYSSPFSTISSGFTSTVNSSHGPAGAPLPGSESIELTILERTLSGSTEGVPPPIYKVLTARVLTISSRRSSISPQTASAYASKHTLRSGEASGRRPFARIGSRSDREAAEDFAGTPDVGTMEKNPQ